MGQTCRALLSPERVTLRTGLRVSAISAGDDCWMAVTDQGAILSWNDDGEIRETSVTRGNDRAFSPTVRAVDVAVPAGSYYDSSALVVDCEGVVHVLGAQMFADDPVWMGLGRKLRL